MYPTHPHTHICQQSDIHCGSILPLPRTPSFLFLLAKHACFLQRSSNPSFFPSYAQKNPSLIYFSFLQKPGCAWVPMFWSRWTSKTPPLYSCFGFWQLVFVMPLVRPAYCGIHVMLFRNFPTVTGSEQSNSSRKEIVVSANQVCVSHHLSAPHSSFVNTFLCKRIAKWSAQITRLACYSTLVQLNTSSVMKYKKSNFVLSQIILTLTKFI